MGERFWLTEAQMGRIRPFFPKARGRKRVDDRRVLSGWRRIRKQSGFEQGPIDPGDQLACEWFSRRTSTSNAMGSCGVRAERHCSE